jgi:hypothetical protein
MLTTDESLRETPRPERWQVLAALVLRPLTWLVLLTVSFFVFVRFRDDAPLLALAFLMAFLVSATRFHDITDAALRKTESHGFRIAACGSVMTVGAGLFVAANWLSADYEGLAVFGFMLFYLGAGIAVAAGRRHAAATRAGLWIVGIGTGLWALGLAALAITGEPLLLAVMAAGFLAAPAGLSLLSGHADSWAFVSSRPRLLVAAAVVAIVLLVLALIVVADWRGIAVALALGGIALALMVAIVTRSNVDVLFVIVTASVLWTFTQREVPVTDTLTVAPGQPYLAAIGDSYMSGEGADEFFERTNTAGVGPLCRRAPTAYPVLLATASDPTFAERVAFFACSGAVVAAVEEQFELFEQAGVDPDQAQLVLVSAGGNDALFGVLGRACLLPGDCSDFEDAFMSHLSVVRSKLDAFYARLASSSVVAQDRIAVVPYPVPISADKRYVDSGSDCDYSPLSPEEHRFLHDYTVALNAVVITTAHEHGLRVVDTMPDALVGARVCDAPANEVGVNFIALNSIQGSLDQSIMPINWVHNSLHPNARGHKLMAAAIAEWWCVSPDASEANNAPARDVAQCADREVELPAAPEEPATPQIDDSEPCVAEAMDTTSSDPLSDCVYERSYEKTAAALFYPGSMIIGGLLALWAVVYVVATELRRRLGQPWNEPAPPLAEGA